MAESTMPLDFHDEIKDYLPPEKTVSPLGGRPAVSHYTVMTVIYYVLVTGVRWRDVPLEPGC